MLLFEALKTKTTPVLLNANAVQYAQYIGEKSVLFSPVMP